MADSDLTPPGPAVEQLAPYPVHAAVPPSGAPYWGGAYAPVVRRPAGLATATLVLAGAVTVVDVLLAVTSALMNQVTDPMSWLYSVLGFGLLSMISVPLLLASYVVSCLWLQRGQEFARVLRPGDPHSYGAAWVWLGWLVPIASLVIPYRVVRDVYRAARPVGAKTGLVLIWWLCWLGSEVAFLAGSDAGDADPHSVLGPVVWAVISMVSFGLWAVVVRRTDRGQQEQELGGRA